MGNFKDHPTKCTIRENWCKPILNCVSRELGKKLVYLGLPGIDCLDIRSWLEYLDKIIAFDCGDYENDPPKVEVVDQNLGKLNETLRNFERSGRIKDYSIYNGYIEEVVLRGIDNYGEFFRQNDIVTVYNLDFCNPLTVPLKLIDEKGNVSKHYKLETIRKLLEIERDLQKSREQKKFIMFLTVHSNFLEKEAKKLVKDVEANLYKEYYKKVQELTGQEKRIRLLKLYVYYYLKEQFNNLQFIPDFLPPIYYKGVGNNYLITFTIFGTFFQDPSGRAPFNQKMDTILKNRFVQIKNKDIFHWHHDKIEETSFPLDPVKLFQRTNTFKGLWSR